MSSRHAIIAIFSFENNYVIYEILSYTFLSSPVTEAKIVEVTRNVAIIKLNDALRISQNNKNNNNIEDRTILTFLSLIIFILHSINCYYLFLLLLVCFSYVNKIFQVLKCLLKVNTK